MHLKCELKNVFQALTLFYTEVDSLDTKAKDKTVI